MKQPQDTGRFWDPAVPRQDDKGTVQQLPFTSDPPTQAPHGSVGLWNPRGTWLVLGWWQGVAPRRGGQLVSLGTLAHPPTDQPDVGVVPRATHELVSISFSPPPRLDQSIGKPSLFISVSGGFLH